MNKFLTDITSGNDAIKKQRGITLANQASRESLKIVNGYQDQLDKQLDILERLNDLAPDQSTSLKYRDDFDAAEWAKNIDTADQQLYITGLKLKRAKDRHNKWFAEEVDGNAKSAD